MRIDQHAAIKQPHRARGQRRVLGAVRHHYQRRAFVVELAQQAHATTGVNDRDCLTYLSGLDWRLSLPHLKGLTEFFNRLERAGKVPSGKLVFLSAA